MGAASRAQLVPTRSPASGYSDQFSTPPTRTSAEQVAFTVTRVGRLSPAAAAVRQQKDAGSFTLR